MANVVRIWESQYHTLKKLPKKDQAKMALAMLEYAFDGSVSVDLNYVQDLALTSMKDKLKVSGTGGCPKGRCNNPCGKNQHSEQVNSLPNPLPNSLPNPLVKGLDKSSPTPPSRVYITNPGEYLNNNINFNNSTTRAKQSAFVAPSLDDVLSYAADQSACAGCGGFACDPRVAEEFWSYYSGLGWVLPNDAQTPIRDWKPFLRKWANQPNRFRSASATRDPDDLPI